MNASELAVLEGLSHGKTLVQIGAELGVGESSVSRTLSHLERLIGLQIVDRQGYRLRLTPTGHDLAIAASRTSQQLRELDDLVAQYRRGEKGRLRVLCSNSPGNYLLPYVMNDFLDGFPEAEVQLDVESVRTIWPAFSQGRYDVGIGPMEGPSNMPRNFLEETAWAWEQLYEDPLVLFISSANPLGRQADVTLQSLAGQTFVGMYGEEFWTRFLERLASTGPRATRIVEFRGIEGVKRMVESGSGIGVHLRSAVAREVREGRLTILDIPEVLPPHRYVLVHRGSQGQRSLVNEFCKLVRKRVPDLSTATHSVPRRLRSTSRRPALHTKKASA